MKSLTMLCILMSATASAFDPAGPPPDRTLAWTVKSLTNITIPVIDFENTPLPEAVDFANRPEIPSAYKVTAKITEEIAARNKRINLKARDMTQMEILAAIAEQAGLDLLIQPGTVVIVPRATIAKGEKTESHATSPEEQSKSSETSKQPTRENYR